MLPNSVPRILKQDQRDDRMRACSDLVDSADKDGTFLNQIITEDETWYYLYDSQLKQQSATWKSLSSRKKEKKKR
jgi:hypothetical protein